MRGMCGCVRVGECELVEDDCVRKNEMEGERETNKSKRKRLKRERRKDIEKE